MTEFLQSAFFFRHPVTMDAGWSQDAWCAFERETTRNALAARSASGKWQAVARSARHVLRTYSTSFFVVTRFLPPAKRHQVEVIYAAVRYPDEVVDTFPIEVDLQLEALKCCALDYEQALECASLEVALDRGLNCFVSAFADVVRRNAIPPEHYRAFLDAMQLDVTPRAFSTLDDLIDSYIYGSAIVVGYFLAYVYGASAPAEFPRTLSASRDLGIALQLTNFLRDVREDFRRGRVYLPLDFLRAEGITRIDPEDESTYPALNRVLRRLSAVAEDHYTAAERELDAFAPDCRVAIQSCIDVYRQLNLRIGRSPRGILHRESVPAAEKFRVLPPSKYWRLPLAYMGAI